MDRYLLIVSTLCFLVAIAHTVLEMRGGIFRPMRFNFFAVGLGFIFQTAFLSIRGHALGRCPITNLFDVIVLFARTIALFYKVVCVGKWLFLICPFTVLILLFLS